MGWEIRKGQRYFYFKVRAPDGKIRSIYCGKEPCSTQVHDKIAQVARELNAMQSMRPPSSEPREYKPSYKLTSEMMRRIWWNQMDKGQEQSPSAL